MPKLLAPNNYASILLSFLRRLRNLEVGKKTQRKEQQQTIFWAILLQSSNLVYKTCARTLLVISRRDF